MTRNEFIVDTAKMILDDWRAVMIANEETKGKFNLPGDMVDISWRAFQKAAEIADEFYST